MQEFFRRDGVDDRLHSPRIPPSSKGNWKTVLPTGDQWSQCVVCRPLHSKPTGHKTTWTCQNNTWQQVRKESKKCTQVVQKDDEKKIKFNKFFKCFAQVLVNAVTVHLFRSWPSYFWFFPLSPLIAYFSFILLFYVLLLRTITTEYFAMVVK